MERNSSVALEVPAILKNHRVWDRHGKSIRLYQEGKLAQRVRGNWTCHSGELAPVEPAEESWTRRGEMDVDDGDHDEQGTKQNNLRNSGEFKLHASPQSWRGRNIFRQFMLCLHRGAKCVCVCVCV